MNRLNSLYRALSPSSRRVLWTIIATTIALLLFSLFLLPSLGQSGSSTDTIAILIPIIITLISTISAISLLYSRVEFGVGLFFISILIGALTMVFIKDGVAYLAALMILTTTILGPLQISSGRKATLFARIGFVASGLIIVIELFWPGTRASITPENIRIVQAGTIGLGILLITSTLILYPSFGLRGKLLFIALGASWLSVIAVATASQIYNQQVFTQNTRQKLLVSVRHTTKTIDSYLEFNTSILQTEANLPIFSRYLAKSGAGRQGLTEVRNTLHNLSKRDTVNINSYALIDKNGLAVWDTRETGIGYNYSNQELFIQPFTTGTIYISPVYFATKPSDNFFYISAPVRDIETNAVLGILRVEIRASSIEKILRDNLEFAGQASYPILLDEYNIILIDPVHPEYVGRSTGQLNAAQINFLREKNRLPANIDETELSLEMNAFTNGLKNINITPFFESDDSAFGESIQGATQYVFRQPWKVAFVQPSSIALAPIREQSRTITATALVISFLLSLLTLIISRTITKPVEQLTRAAEEISNGNLEVHADIRSKDELGTLASTLNAMSEQLKQTLDGLAATIDDRTADLEQRRQELLQRSTELELANQRSERRAAQLLAVSTVSNAITTVQNLDELLPLITRTISEKFGFYHVGIFLNDVSNEFAVLRAANSQGGQRMLARGHRLKIGETGIVGNVVALGRPRIALDTGTDAVFFDNPDLPNTRSEMALPLRAGQNVIGALDVQSTEPNAFTEEDVEILNALAGQVSIAIRNAQLFEEIQRSTAELQMLLQQDVHEQWKRVTQGQKRAGYYYDGVALTPLEKPIQKNDDIVQIPVTVRGQTIGNLGLRPPTGRKLKPDELDVIKAVSERLAISAENARLIEDSQKQAAKERKVSEITSKIRSTNDPNEMIQIAINELKQTLGVRDARILPYKPTQDEKG